MKPEKRKRPLSPGKEKRPEKEDNWEKLNKNILLHSCIIRNDKLQPLSVKPPSNDRIEVAGHCPYSGQQFQQQYKDRFFLSTLSMGVLL